jgi:P-aminobenzoate N-oxygenase AurF
MTTATNPKQTKITDRTETAERLLRSSLEHSYEPSTDVDWDAPVLPGVFAIPPHRVSLYGTDLWERLSHDQRVELSKHEVCSVARIGVWFEIILMQLLLRYAYDRDPRDPHIHYALTEIADECRHSIMFGRMIEKYGVPDYTPRRLTNELGRFFKTVGYGPALFAGALIAEEITDQLQRESMRDESIQPLTRQVNQIHVTEEARHVRYAREELARLMPRTNRLRRAVARFTTAQMAVVIANNLVHRDVYAAVGIDPKVGYRAAQANPNHQETKRWTARKLVPFLREMGLIGGPTELQWRRAHLI